MLITSACGTTPKNGRILMDEAWPQNPSDVLTVVRLGSTQDRCCRPPPLLAHVTSPPTILGPASSSVSSQRCTPYSGSISTPFASPGVMSVVETFFEPKIVQNNDAVKSLARAGRGTCSSPT
ncbi:unnamed protein product [Sphacelaria rigidula]